MNNNEIYRIPKNLNSEFQILSFYTQSDAIILITLLMFGFFGAIVLHANIAMLPCAVTAVLRYRHNGYTLYFWAKIALAFLSAKYFHTNEYVLFERWRDVDGDD